MAAKDKSPSRKERTPPPPWYSAYIPTRTEILGLAIFPTVLIVGSWLSTMDETAKYLGSSAEQQALLREQGFQPMYFSQKTNVFNVYFVKRGWAWVSFVMFAFASTYPDMSNGQRARALLRWGANTLWWFFVTQWFFGAPIIDRGFRWSGGKCHLAQMDVDRGVATAKELFTAATCKSSGGKWQGGHDISGHVFLMTLGSAMIMSELGWVMARWSAKVPEERTVITVHGETKSVSDIAETPIGLGRNMDVWMTSGKFGVVVVGLNLWMMLMTAMYFHTWFEKTTGLVTAYIGIYAIYIAPRHVPLVRSIIGIPGAL